MEIFSQMLWPLLACFILVGIHAYLGIHVIARKVIFVDLALAQIAGLGAVYGVFIGLSFEGDPWLIKIISVGFTLLGALLFAVTRTKDERIPHEAIIGIIYASALSLTVLLTTNLPHGAEEVQQMLSGSILWVTPSEVVQTAILYSLVGMVHIVFRRQFFALSSEIAIKSPPTRAIKLWDFLFYATFGVVVTSSVGMGGVLLVFGYLVIPSVIGVMLAETMKARLLIGWGCGVLMSILGVILSYYGDVPSGPCIVVLLALLLVMVGVERRLRQPSLRLAALMQVLVMAAIVIGVASAPQILRRFLKTEIEEDHARRHRLGHETEDPGARLAVIRKMLGSTNRNEVLDALSTIKNMLELEAMPEVLALLNNGDSAVREQAALVIGQSGWREGLPSLKQAFKKERDDFIRIEIAEAVLTLKEAEGLSMLAKIWLSSTSELARQDAMVHLQQWLAKTGLEGPELLKWLQANSQKLEFDEKTGKYIIK